MRQLFRELKRRNVYRVAATYVAAAFVTLQAARLIFPATTLEGLYDKLVVLTFVGFPIALVIAWAFELTPEGVRRTREVERGGEAAGEPRPAGSGLPPALGALVGLGLLAAAGVGTWYLVGAGGDTGPGATDRSIAVLPFTALSPDERSRTFSRGIHDDLLTRLAHVSGMTVISRTAVETYRDSELTTGAIADSLGVRWVMEGGVQKLGDQIQVNAQLIDPRSEAHVWAERYRRELTPDSLFALQGEITRRIARSLEAELTPEENAQLARRPTGSLDAYRLYVEGRRLLDSRTEHDIFSAAEHFHRAIRQDSGYALAWAGLADAAGLYREYVSDSLPRAMPEQERAARRALELAPDLAEAHASLALVHLQNRAGPAALRELQRAVELKPSYAQAQNWLGSMLLLLGQAEQALEHIRLAVELDPGNPSLRDELLRGLLANGRYEEAVEAAHEMRARSGDEDSFWYYWEMVARAHLEDWTAVRALAGKSVPDSVPSGEAPVAALGLAELAAGDTTAARGRLAAVAAYDPFSEVVRQAEKALLQAELGDHAEALTSLTRAVEAAARAPDPWSSYHTVTLRVRYFYPDVLAPLESDPRYRELLREINVAWGLNPDGSLPDGVDVSFEGGRADG